MTSPIWGGGGATMAVVDPADEQHTEWVRQNNVMYVASVAGVWNITWIAGATFLVTSFIAVFVHSAGYWRLERRSRQ